MVNLRFIVEAIVSMPVMQEHKIKIPSDFFKCIFYLANFKCQSQARNIEAIWKGKHWNLKVLWTRNYGLSASARKADFWYHCDRATKSPLVSAMVRQVTSDGGDELLMLDITTLTAQVANESHMPRWHEPLSYEWVQRNDALICDLHREASTHWPLLSFDRLLI